MRAVGQFVCAAGVHRGTKGRDEAPLAAGGSGGVLGTTTWITSTAVETAWIQPRKTSLQNSEELCLDVLCKDSSDSVGNIST